MSVIELIPLDKGNRLLLDQSVVTTVGRTPNVGCMDKKISRNHAELYTKADGTLCIKAIHNNPTFYRPASKQLITLKKDQEQQLNHNDEIGLLPNEYFYRISIQSDDNKEEEEVREPSAIPKASVQQRERSPAEEKSSSPIGSPQREQSPAKDPTVEKEGGVILHTTRALPTWMSNATTPEAKATKGRGKSKTPVKTPTKASPPKHQTYVRRKKAEGVVYEDDDDDDEEEQSKQTSTTTVATGQSSSTATSPKKRERCPYGKFCYRKNPHHRQEAIHPGDSDWDDKENDTEPKKPECPYGSDCYRKNPDHLKEYSHNEKRSSIKTKGRASKRKGSDEDDDDDGLPNEYDYNDSFIDDEELEDSALVDRAGGSQDEADNDWKPHKRARPSDGDDDDESSADSEVDLLNEEAAEFIQDSSVNRARSAKKKARTQMPKDDD